MATKKMDLHDGVSKRGRRIPTEPLPAQETANDRQVGGAHYAKPIQHWDYVIAQGLGYFEGQITKYVSRWRDKNGLEDLKKARHFLDKLIEEVEAGNINA